MELIIASFIVLGLYMAAEALYERNWYKNVYTDIAFEKEYMKYGEPVTMIIEAGNNSRIYLTVLIITYEIWRNGRVLHYRKERISLKSKQKVVRKHVITDLMRGLYEIRNIRIISKGLFLKNEYRVVSECKAWTTVFPKVDDISMDEIPVDVIAGECCADTRLLENPYYFMGVRDYDDNDTFSEINWNATAAMGRMMSSIYEDRRMYRVQLVCEFPDRYVMDCDAIAEKMITVVCSIYKSLMAAGEYVSIICNAADCVTHEPVVIENGTDIDIVLESMARIDTASTIKTAALQEKQSGEKYFINLSTYSAFS